MDSHEDVRSLVWHQRGPSYHHHVKSTWSMDGRLNGRSQEFALEQEEIEVEQLEAVRPGWCMITAVAHGVGKDCEESSTLFTSCKRC